MNIFRQIANEPTPVLNPAKEIPHPHNWVLQIILELGLIGLLAYISLVSAAYKHLGLAGKITPQFGRLYWAMR